MSNQEHQPEPIALTRPSVDELERVIIQVSWLVQRQFMQLLDDDRFRVTVPQFHTLLHLYQAHEGCKMSDLADATHLAAASLTGVVDRLIEKGLVERIRQEQDRRQVLVFVTRRGQELVAEIKQARREQLRATLAHIGAVEMEHLVRLLEEVQQAMIRGVDPLGESSRWA